MNVSEIENKIKELEANLKNDALKDYHKDFKDGIADLKLDIKKLEGDSSDNTPKSKAKPKPKAKAKPKTRAKKKAPTKDEYASAMADLKKKSGKTEDECLKIIEDYRELRKKSQVRKTKETQAKNKTKDLDKKRKEKLEKEDKLNEDGALKPEAVIEQDIPKVEKKIEKEIEKIQEDNTPPPTKEEPTPKPTSTQQAKIKKEVTKVVDESVVAIQDMLKAIMGVVAKNKQKDVAKKQLIQLRDALTEEINKMAWGGLTNGANANMNITNSQMSAESVNPQMYARGGRMASGGSVNMDKHIWEGWTIRDFIEGLEIEFQYHPTFKSRNEVKKWAMESQPYYKKYIPEVVDYYWGKSQNRHETYDFAKGGSMASGGTIIKKGNRVRVVNTKYDGKEGLVVSDDLHNGNYIVQLEGGYMKGFPFENLMLLSRDTYAEGGSMASGGEIKMGDFVANKVHKTVGEVIDVFDRNDFRTDADGVVNGDDLEIYSKTKHKSYQIAPSTQDKMGGSMARGGRILVGRFNEKQLKNKEDKKALAKAKKESGLTYTDTKIIKKGGKMFLEVYLIPNEEYYNSTKYSKGGSMASGGEVIDTFTSIQGSKVMPNNPFTIEKENEFYVIKNSKGEVLAKDTTKDGIMNDKGMFLNLYAKGGSTNANWVGDVVNSPNFDKGAFSTKAKNRGMTSMELMKDVISNPNEYTMKTRRQAQFMYNAM